MTSTSKWLLLILVGLLPVVRPLSFSFGAFTIPTADLVFPVLFVAFTFAVISGGLRVPFQRFHLFIAAYGVALFLSAVFSDFLSTSLLKLLGVGYLTGLALISFSLLDDRAFLKQIVSAWLAGTALTVFGTIAGIALFYVGYKTSADNYFLSHFGSLPKGNYPRVHSLFANANMLCNYLNVSLVFALLAHRNRWLRRSWSILMQAGIWIAAIFTFSSGIGGLFLSQGLWLAATNRGGLKSKTNRIILGATVLIAVAAFASTLVSPVTGNTEHRFKLPWVNIEVEPSVRVLVWEDTLIRFRANPLLGVGTGVDPTRVSYRTLSGETQLLRDAHNVWLSIAGQAGVIGLLALIAFTYYLLICSRFKTDNPNEVVRSRIAASCAFAGAFLYQGLTGSFEDARHLWILFGILAATSLWRENDISKASEAL